MRRAEVKVSENAALNGIDESILVSSGISVSARGDVRSPKAPADDAAWPKAAARIGSTLRGKWRLDALLGIGGMAAVYAATHRNGSRVAVKILHPELSANASAREKFLWEGYVTNAVGHEGVVKVIDDEDDDGSPFLVTELLEGETVEEYRCRRGGRLSQEEVLTIAYEVLAVLEAAHANGIVHRDIKPENVFLTREGRIKLLDFGIARLRRPFGRTGPTHDELTSGTPAYMPPEQAGGLVEQIDERSDLWACGATMFSLLSGRTVHTGRTFQQQLARAMTQPAPALSTVVADLDPAVAHVVDKALAFDRGQRWSSANEMRAAVGDAYQRLTGRSMAGACATSGAEPTPTGSDPYIALRRWQSRRRAVALAAGALLLGFVLPWIVSAAELPGSLHPAAVVAPSVEWPTPTVPLPAAPAATLADLVATPVAQETSPRATASPHPTRGGLASTLAQQPTSPQPDCEPPYVVDEATGKKTWKLDCL